MSIQSLSIQRSNRGEFYHTNPTPEITVEASSKRKAQAIAKQAQEPAVSPNLTDEYQVLPPLSDEEYQALKQDIDENGVQEAVIVDERYNVIDGYHRVRACRDLGYNPDEIPHRVRTDLSEKEKRQLAYRRNLARRHLESGQKRQIAEQYLQNEWDGDASEREIATILGVSKSTVHRAKESLRSNGKLVQVDQFSTAEEREQIRRYLETHPDASDREIARNIAAEITHPTVSSHRKEIETDDSSHPDQQTLDALHTPTSQSEDRTGQQSSDTSQPLSTPSSERHPQSDEKATPRSFFQPIEKAIGGFDLDPAAGAESEPLASETYTIADDGLQAEWHGDVWLNPPFSNMGEWVDKIQTELDAGRVDTVVLLCKGDSSTDWWQEAAATATFITAVDHRLSFVGDESAAPFPIHLMIFGDIPWELAEVLFENGLLLTTVDDFESLSK